MSNVRLFKCNSKTETERGVDVHFSTQIENGPNGQPPSPGKAGHGTLNFSAMAVTEAAAFTPGKVYEVGFKEVSIVSKG